MFPISRVKQAKILTRLIELARPCAARSQGCIMSMKSELTHSRPVTPRGLGVN
jgi:hypothetical protein